MTPPIPTIEPGAFAAGETVQWTKTSADYPNTDGWSLIYSFRGPTAINPDVTATNNADGSYSVTLSATVTAALASGTYQWAAYATKGSGASLERHPVDSGVILVTTLLVGGAALVSHAAKTLDVIEAAIEGRLTADMQSYSINGRAITKIPIERLYALRSQYRAEVWRERNPKKSNPVRRVAFVRA